MKKATWIFGTLAPCILGALIGNSGAHYLRGRYGLAYGLAVTAALLGLGLFICRSAFSGRRDG